MKLMKKSLILLYSLVCTLIIFSSCSDDEKTVLSNDCYMSSFSLGNIKRLVHITTAAGTDSSYYATYNGSYYTMVIDQRNNTICNIDSLPVESKTNAILVTAESSGTIIYRYTNESGENWLSYSSSDSIDFTRPLIFRVVSADGNATRDYTVKLNVHQQDGETFTWNEMKNDAEWNSANQIKSIIWNEKVYVYALYNTQTKLYSSDLTDGKNWTVLQTNNCENAMLNTLTSFKDKLYMSCTDGSIIMSTDGSNWTTHATSVNVSLLTANNRSIYGLRNGLIVRSSDALSWTDETLDDNADKLPTQDIATIAYTQENGIERVLMLGNRNPSIFTEDTAAVVWSKSISPYQEEGDKWAYFPWSIYNSNVCPQLKALNLVEYNHVLLALGGSSLNGKHQALDNLYVSNDNGISWETNATYTLPESLKNTSELITAVADNEYNLWIFAGSKIWKGRLNKLSFNK